jgi:hypothetical protein
MIKGDKYMARKGIFTKTIIDGRDVSADVMSYSADLQGASINGGQPSSVDITLHNKLFQYNTRTISYMGKVTIISYTTRYKKSGDTYEAIIDSYPTFAGIVQKVDMKSDKCMIKCEDQGGKYGEMLEAERSFKPHLTSSPLTIDNIRKMNQTDYTNVKINPLFFNKRSSTLYQSQQPTIFALQKEVKQATSIGFITAVNEFVITHPLAVHLHWNVDGFLTSQSDTLSAIGYCNRVEVIGGAETANTSKKANIVTAEGADIKGKSELVDPLIPIWIDAPKYSDPTLTTKEACDGKANDLIIYYEAFKNAETNPVLLGIIPDLRSEIIYTMKFKGVTPYEFETSCHIHTNRVEYGPAGLLSNITGGARSSNAEMGKPDDAPTNVRPGE